MRLLEPLRRVVDPVCLDAGRVPERGPALLVGNHTVYGLQDAPVMVAELHRRRGLFPRALGDHAHFVVPGWGDLLRAFGVVDGTRENCRRLLADGAVVLVFPGGAREVMKRRGERYRLVWKQRLGFARMAIERGCPIVPFGAVGADDTYDILLDAGHPIAAPVRALVERLGGRGDELPPIARGIGPTPVPRPERFYFAFGEPIATDEFAGRADDQRALRVVRDRTRTAVEHELARLLAVRDDDPERGLLPRLVAGARRRGAARADGDHRG